ncbi:MAG TPA: type II toxin-antitoxin system HigB family toxin [Pedobacter sp.]
METFNIADLLGKSSNRVIFDIGGNNFRMICKYVFGAKQAQLFVCWMWTHAEYNKICKQGEQYNLYLLTMVTTAIKYTVIKNKDQYNEYCD